MKLIRAALPSGFHQLFVNVFGLAADGFQRQRPAPYGLALHPKGELRLHLLDVYVPGNA